MGNKTITQIYADDSISALTGQEKVWIDDPNDSDASKGTLTGNIAALARNISGTDHDIGTGNKTADISTLTGAGAGTLARYSWYDGDGTYTFSFTNTAGITIDGIASSEYIGEGTGHLDLYVVSASACVTINRGEIWDNDGGTHTYKYSKYLSGKMTMGGDFTTGAAATTMTFSISFSNADYQPSGNTLVNSTSGTDFTVKFPGPSRAVGSMSVVHTAAGALAAGDVSINIDGRWTDSYPRIT